MPSAREQILSKVHSALAPIPNRAAMPDWDSELAVVRGIVDNRDPVELFAERIALVSGRASHSIDEIVAVLRQGGWMRGYCDPVLWPRFKSSFGPDFQVSTEYDRTKVDECDFGITRASAGIAETGTIVLDDTTTSRRLAALAPWVHIAVLAKSKIYLTLTDAAQALPADPNVIWVTGPSKTADIEGILIEGVHGPGVQYALLVD